jgi:hypothetical protein
MIGAAFRALIVPCLLALSHKGVTLKQYQLVLGSGWHLTACPDREGHIFIR